MDYKFLRIRKEDEVALVEFNNPPQNFMTTGMVKEMYVLARELEQDPQVRAIVFTGAVPDIFIYHFDVSELKAMSEQGLGYSKKMAQLFLPLVKRLNRRADRSASFEKRILSWLEKRPNKGELLSFIMHSTYERYQRMGKPVIAAINGMAMGGGCEFAMSCDFRFMAKGEGRIGLPEALIGILPGGGGTQRMTRLLGSARALELMLLGKVLTPEEAEEIGLIHKAVEPGELLPYSMEIARTLARRPPVSVRLIKDCVHRGGGTSFEEGIDIEKLNIVELMGTEDATRGMSVYLGKQAREGGFAREYQLEILKEFQEGKVVKYIGK